MKIYRVIRTYPFTDAVYPETDWHVSYDYCAQYLKDMDPIRREFYNYIIEMNELIKD